MSELGHIWKKIRIPFILLFFALGFGILGYHLIYPEQSFWKLLYMTTITLSTVGYTDLFNIFESPMAVIYTMFVMLIGMGLVLYSVSTITAYFVEGSIDQIFLIHSILRRIKKMEDHYVICGAGSTGIHVVREMDQVGQKVVIIDINEEVVESIRKEFKNILILKGDATIEKMLDQANLKTAKGLVVALSNDKDNLFVTLTARLNNPKLLIVSRSIDLNMHDKLIMAGANYVVSPNFIGGMRMASEILRPNVVSFLDKMLRGADKSIRINESIIPSNFKYAGKTLEELKLYEHCGVNILGIKNEKSPGYHYNPGPQFLLNEGDVLLFIGAPNQKEKVDSFFSS